MKNPILEARYDPRQTSLYGPSHEEELQQKVKSKNRPRDTRELLPSRVVFVLKGVQKNTGPCNLS